jgi:hypothetical protein
MHMQHVRLRDNMELVARFMDYLLVNYVEGITIRGSWK